MTNEPKIKTHSKEFKLNAIRMYLSGQYGGYTLVSKMLDVCRTNLVNYGCYLFKRRRIRFRRWQGKGRNKTIFITPQIEGLPIQDENLRLKAENAYLRSLLKLNIDIIKKNILNRNFIGNYPFDKMATDITEIKKSGKTIYISPIKDFYTNMIESREISYNATLKTATNPLLKIKDKALPEGTFLHSDQGGLYTCPLFKDILAENNFIQSFSRKGTPIDNSPMESFFCTLKSELLYNPLIPITNDIDMVNKINDYINYNNNDRIEKKLDYLTPAEFKARSLENK